MEKGKVKKVKFHIKKGDKVEVISGNHKGKSGVVLEVLRAKNRAIVEGVNLVTKHIKPSAESPEGGVEKTEAGIHISNLMLVDPKTGEKTKVGRKLDSNGKLKRYSKKTEQFID
ncbi:50S ribosomal protein L24 [Chondrinema litorale]|uniref:50S ribosomal protein L24 n=1 Tax=Chondrinema litorale TaxID=2994555 RepID=UPI00254476F9|nr:50S ribosomal protein L24 [Chondrinema litorale]UZR92380.1 50S ribosomal protein L24 [Chondrinema litorale]